MSHGATKRINLFYQMALANTANGWITGHLTKRFDVVRQQQGLRPHAGRGESRLSTSMAATNDNHIKTRWKIHNITSEIDVKKGQ
jgi:hypothetical protein